MIKLLILLVPRKYSSKQCLGPGRQLQRKESKRVCDEIGSIFRSKTRGRGEATRCQELLFEVAGASGRSVEGLDHGKPPLTLALLGVASDNGQTDHFSRSRQRCGDR